MVASVALWLSSTWVISSSHSRAAARSRLMVRGTFGLVVDDKEAVREAMQQGGVVVQASGSLDFHDPWGNHVQVVDYREIQFTKETGVLRDMRLHDMEKSESAQQELRDKGLAD
ncbi:MAG: hypothetical protein ACLP50_29210 [Solirubrobacteraceae bacterium]